MSSTQQQYSFNGVLSTDKTVLQNLETLTEACNSFLTFDINTGKWCVIINRAGSSVKSFSNSNIIGSITVSGTGLNDLYNKVVVEFPHKDLADQTDAIISQVDSSALLPNEQTNVLNLKYDIINDPIQAELLGTVKLKQSRVDKIIKFRTDFSSLGLKAGDLIDVTSDVYSYTNKIFRIIAIEEEDADDGSIVLAITALEYDSNVYNNSGLHRTLRTPLNGIIQKVSNTAIQTDEETAQGNSILATLIPLAATSLFNAMFPGITKSIMDAQGKPGCTVTLSPSSACAQNTFTATVAYCASCADYTGVTVPYEITGISSSDTSTPLTGNVTLNSSGSATLSIPTNLSAGGKTITFKAASKTATATVTAKLDFTYATTASPLSITEGGSSTVTLATTGVANGTTVPYTISGTATSKVTTPLTGTVTVNGDSATLTINTTDDAVYTGSQTLTVTFNSAQADPCNQLDKTAAITVLDNETPPVDPPTPPADTACSYVSIPVVWCGVFDGTDNQLKSVTAVHSILVAKPLAGEATITVPKTLTVTKGNPSTIAVATTETIAANTSTMGGHPTQVITTFNSVIPKGLITGTTTTIYGY